VKSISGKDFAKLLEKKGWELKRIKGSHHVYTKIDNQARISLPIHKNTPLKIGLLKHLMGIAGIEEKEL